MARTYSDAELIEWMIQTLNAQQHRLLYEYQETRFGGDYPVGVFTIPYDEIRDLTGRKLIRSGVLDMYKDALKQDGFVVEARIRDLVAYKPIPQCKVEYTSLLPFLDA